MRCASNINNFCCFSHVAYIDISKFCYKSGLFREYLDYVGQFRVTLAIYELYCEWEFLYSTVHLLLQDFRISLKSSLNTQSVSHILVSDSESNFGPESESESGVINFLIPELESHENKDSTSIILTYLSDSSEVRHICLPKARHVCNFLFCKEVSK